MKIIKVRDFESLRRAMVNRNKLKERGDKNLEKENELAKKFLLSPNDKKLGKRLELVITGNYRLDEVKIEQLKNIEAYLRKRFKSNP